MWRLRSPRQCRGRFANESAAWPACCFYCRNLFCFCTKNHYFCNESNFAMPPAGKRRRRLTAAHSFPFYYPYN